jgi:fermentation-respiration switch protein FrsA (DUF1100 family)
MRRVLCAGMAVAMLMGVAIAATDQDVTVTSAGAALHGSLLLPDGARDYPAVLIIAGSGPTDRDGNGPMGLNTNTYRMLAEGLATHGIASLRFDKRGIAASAAAMTAEKDLRFDTYVDDAVVWAQYLKSQPHVSCLFILGHSEGALVGTLASARAKPCGFISVAGEGERAGRTLLRQLRARNLPEAQLDYAANVISQLEHGQLAPNIPASSVLFRPSVQPYLISYFSKDPQAAIAAVSGPVLILQGTTDIQISIDDAKLLAAAHSGAKLVLLDGVNHVLKIAPADLEPNLATYGDPSLPLAPSVLPAITGFVKNPR